MFAAVLSVAVLCLRSRVALVPEQRVTALLGYKTPKEFAEAQAAGFYTAVREERDSNAVLFPSRSSIPAQSRGGSNSNLSYSYLNESGGHIRTHPVCKGPADSGVGKRRMRISGLSMEEVSSSGP
jgi:hypothetical protein